MIQYSKVYGLIYAVFSSSQGYLLIAEGRRSLLKQDLRNCPTGPGGISVKCCIVEEYLALISTSQKAPLARQDKVSSYGVNGKTLPGHLWISPIECFTA